MNERCRFTFRRCEDSSGDKHERLKDGRQERCRRGDAVERVEYARVDGGPEGREEVFQRVF